MSHEFSRMQVVFRVWFVFGSCRLSNPPTNYLYSESGSFNAVSVALFAVSGASSIITPQLSPNMARNRDVSLEQALAWCETLPGWFLHRLARETADLPGFSWPKVGWSAEDDRILKVRLQMLLQHNVRPGELKSVCDSLSKMYREGLELGIAFRHQFDYAYRLGDMDHYLNLNYDLGVMKDEIAVDIKLVRGNPVNKLDCNVFMKTDAEMTMPVMKIEFNGTYADIRINDSRRAEGERLLGKFEENGWVRCHQRRDGDLVATLHDFEPVTPPDVADSDAEMSESENSESFEHGGPAVCGE